MADKKAKDKKENVEVKPLNKGLMRLMITGDSDLIVNRMSNKTRDKIKNKAQGKAGCEQKEHINPVEEFMGALYHIEDNKKKYGFKCSAFKLAAVKWAWASGNKTLHAKLKHGHFVMGDFTEIRSTNGKKIEPYKREDDVRVQKAAVIRTRPAFKDWSVVLTIQYDKSMLTPEIIANVYDHAGFGVGVGEWRPDKKGTFGMYHVCSV